MYRHANGIYNQHQFLALGTANKSGPGSHKFESRVADASKHSKFLGSSATIINILRIEQHPGLVSPDPRSAGRTATAWGTLAHVLPRTARTAASRSSSCASPSVSEMAPEGALEPHLVRFEWDPVYAVPFPHGVPFEETPFQTRVVPSEPEVQPQSRPGTPREQRQLCLPGSSPKQFSGPSSRGSGLAGAGTVGQLSPALPVWREVGAGSPAEATRGKGGPASERVARARRGRATVSPGRGLLPSIPSTQQPGGDGEMARPHHRRGTGPRAADPPKASQGRLRGTEQIFSQGPASTHSTLEALPSFFSREPKSVPWLEDSSRPWLTGTRGANS